MTLAPHRAHDEVVDSYAARRSVNIASRGWASRDRQPWTAEDDSFLIDNWIDVDPAGRDEVTISQCLERTIEACRVRCEHIRSILGIKTRVIEPAQVAVIFAVCPVCWMELPATGKCDGH